MLPHNKKNAKQAFDHRSRHVTIKLGVSRFSSLLTMATAEQTPASEQDYENVTNAERDYETLTRENTDYARLSDLKLLDSGSFENPEVLDKHPWQHDRYYPSALIIICIFCLDLR